MKSSLRTPLTMLQLEDRVVLDGAGKEVFINFDELPNFTTVTNQYEGVVFSSGAGFGNVVTNINAGFGGSDPMTLGAYYPAGGSYNDNTFADFPTPVNDLKFLVLADNDAGTIAAVNVFQKTDGGTKQTAVPVPGDGNFNTPILMDLSAFKDVTRIEIVNITDRFGLVYDNFSFLIGGGDLGVTIDTSGVVPSKAPDLRLNHIFGTEEVKLPVTITNGTEETLNGSVTVEVFLSTTNDLDGITGKALVKKQVNLKNLEGGGEHPVEGLVGEIPKSLDKGTEYYLVAKITPKGNLAKGDDESDNVAGTSQAYDYMGTPAFPKAFQDGRYFDLIRQVFNGTPSNVVAAYPGIDLNDPQSFISTFEGDFRYPYLDARNIATIGVGINLESLKGTVTGTLAEEKQTLINGVRAYYAANYPKEKLPADDERVLDLLIKQAKQNGAANSKKSKGAIVVIDEATDSALFDLAFKEHADRAKNGLNAATFDGLSTAEQIAVVDQVYNTGSVFPGMATALEAGDFVRAGYELVDAKRTQDGYNKQAGIFLRLEAEYFNLLRGHASDLGEFVV